MSADRGANPLPQSLRQALWPLALLYGGVAAARNGLFALGWKKVHRLEVPVVSIGNLSVGGTGKTPTTAWLCKLAKDAGRTPGVLARGYGRADGASLNDEGVLLQRRLPWLLQEQDPDRVAAGRRLVQRGADFVVLDDGFQHRRLHRDLDIVCLDATMPFGNGHCLPAGDLREFRSGLRRAGLVLLTRAGDLDREQFARRVQRIRQISANPAIGVYACVHAPTSCVARPSGEELPLDELRGRRVVLLSAIARPQSFRATVERLGCVVAAELVHRDHHCFRADELALAAATARDADALLLTTEKDDARIDDAGLDRHVVRIDLQFVDAPPQPSELML
ncbi:MAG: tetraacyldisaccharide 4'-kinase [Planctomycetes bacterium]|nr:tetraacyldisaccharide 4'-kinase [Planctomycetota bacterium]